MHQLWSFTPNDYVDDTGSYLWADALNHLNHPAGISETITTMGSLYLAATTLPQYWLHGDYISALNAMSRGWMHQELAYGRLDRAALTKFFAICTQRYKSQTGGSRWKGNPFHLEGPQLLGRLIAKRIKAAGVGGNLNASMTACEWFARANKVAGVPQAFSQDGDDCEARGALRDHTALVLSPPPLSALSA